MRLQPHKYTICTATTTFLYASKCGVLYRKTKKLKCDLQQQNNEHKAAVEASVISQIVTKTTKPIKGG
jgi:hypothetical protein